MTGVSDTPPKSLLKAPDGGEKKEDTPAADRASKAHGLLPFLTTPSSTSKRFSETAKAANLGGRRPSWSVTLLPTRSLKDSGKRSGDRPSGKGDERKGDGDEMTPDRRERMEAHIRRAGNLDHLGLRHYPNLIDTLRRKEKGFPVAGWHPTSPDGHPPSKPNRIILFSARNAPLVNKTESRAVCVTERAVHLLAHHKAGLDTAKTGNYRVLHTFDLSSLVTIIESKKDPLSVCLDFRAATGESQSVADRKPILPSVPDASYVLFPFKDKDKDLGREVSSGDPASKSWIGGMLSGVSPGADAVRSGTTTVSEKDEFVAVLYMRFWPVPPECDLPKASLVVFDTLSFRTEDDAQRAISKVVRKGQLEDIEKSSKANTASWMVSLMPAERGDKLLIAQDASAVKSLRAYGDKKIIFSCKIETLNRFGKIKAELALILTDRAVCYVDEEHFDKVIRRVELQHLEKIFLEDNTMKDADAKQWDVLIRLDLANDRSTKDFSSDLLFRCEMKHQRELLVRSIQSSYEDIVINKLPVETTGNIRSFKRGKLEAWLHSLRSSGEQKLLMDRRTEESLRWLVYLLKYKLRFFLSILTEVLPVGEVHLFAKSLVSLCEAGGITDKLLTDVMSVEMDTNSSITTIFRGTSLTSVILRVYVYGDTDREGNVEEYLRLVLAHTLREFDKVNPNIEITQLPPGANPSLVRSATVALWEWCDRFYDRITSIVTADAMPHEMRRVVEVIYDACIQRALDPNPYIGGYLMLRVFCPAITTPHTYNLTKEMNAVKTRKLLLIARLLQSLVNNTFINEHREPALALAMNWWLRKFGGSDRETCIAPPQEYTRCRGDYPRVTWQNYIKRLVAGCQGAQLGKRDDESSQGLDTQHDIERLVAEGDFMDGWEDTHVLAGVHNRLTKYTEQILSILWTSTGVKKRTFGELEDQLERLKEEEDDLNTDTEIESVTPQGRISLSMSPATNQSPYTAWSADVGSPAPAARPHGQSPRGGTTSLKAKNDLIKRRATLWATGASPMSDEDEDDTGRDPADDSVLSSTVHAATDATGTKIQRKRSGLDNDVFLQRSALGWSPRGPTVLRRTSSTRSVSPVAPDRRGSVASEPYSSRPVPEAAVVDTASIYPIDARGKVRERVEEWREKEEYLAYLREVLESKNEEHRRLTEENQRLEMQIARYE